jgi:hypothetical protein
LTSPLSPPHAQTNALPPVTGMTKRLPFTAAAIARAIERARKAGLPITATNVAPDGMVTIHHQGVASPTLPDPNDSEAREWADA